MERGIPVYTLFVKTDQERAMKVHTSMGHVLLTEFSEGGTEVIWMTPHRARAVGERLIAMADGIVTMEDKA